MSARGELARGTIGPNVAKAALAVRRKQPDLSPKQILDLCMKQRTGSVADFGDEVQPGSEFSALLCDAMGCKPSQLEDALVKLAQLYGLKR